MNMKLKVRENERLIRDAGNFAILNTDRSQLRTHEQKMEALRKRKAQEEEINTIKNDISEIKELLGQLLTQRR
jgi:hypothetical protein